MEIANYMIDLLLSLSQNLGYPGIILLMAVESSFIPFPSEIVIPPAAYLASQGQMNILLVILSGLIGSLIGALVNYYLALYLGRALIYRIADHKISNLFLLNSKKIKKAEDYFLKYGNISTLLGRFIPAIRQLISLPAGFARLNFKNFIGFTALGSGIWVIILAILGYTVGSNQELLARYYGEITIVIILIIAAIILGYLINIVRKKRKIDDRD